MTEYSKVFGMFKDKITDYELIQIPETYQTETLIALMNVACAKFSRICKVSLSDRDDTLVQFNCDIDDYSMDIITEWMLVGWLKQYVNNTENLRNNLSTKDFSFFSPANLLDKITATYEITRKNARSMMNEYSYVNGKISGLKS